MRAIQRCPVLGTGSDAEARGWYPSRENELLTRDITAVEHCLSTLGSITIITGVFDAAAGTATQQHFLRALPLPSKPLRSAVTQLTCNRLAVADRREGAAGLWLGASIALTRVRRLR